MKTVSFTLRATCTAGDVLIAMASHHARFDGKGYPRGLRGEEIPPLDRITALADACSVMLLTRPYRQGLSWPETAAELRCGAGTQFDPALVKPFIAAMEESGLVAADLVSPLGGAPCPGVNVRGRSARASKFLHSHRKNDITVIEEVSSCYTLCSGDTCTGRSANGYAHPRRGHG